MKKTTIIKALAHIDSLVELSEQEVELLQGIKTKLENLSEVSEPSNGFKGHEDVLAGKFSYALYSDGACRGNPGPGSYGCFIDSQSETIWQEANAFELTTNNKMELLGVIRGLEHAKEDSLDRIVVVTDSKYVVNGMDSWVESWKKRGWKKADKKAPENVDLWQRLDELRLSFSSIAFQWVKGHSGHFQNEICDQMANKVLDEMGY